VSDRTGTGSQKLNYGGDSINCVLYTIIVLKDITKDGKSFAKCSSCSFIDQFASN